MSKQHTSTPVTMPAHDLPSFDHGTLLESLFEKAESSMSADELRHLSGQAHRLAEESARRAALVAERLGCLVADDGGATSPSGHFQGSDDVPALLWHFSEVFSGLAGLVSVSDRAGYAAQRGKS